MSARRTWCAECMSPVDTEMCLEVDPTTEYTCTRPVNHSMGKHVACWNIEHKYSKFGHNLSIWEDKNDTDKNA